jgi:cob(I)alamin adenosyltransferase
MKIYTRTGDSGETGLFGGGRVGKDDARVEAYGAVDELNAVLGWIRSQGANEAIADRLGILQADLFVLGSHLASPPAPPGRRRPGLPPLPETRVGEMERWIDEAEAELEPLRSFVLPAGEPSATALHLARTVCRRAERRVVALARSQAVEPGIVVYLNRLSDLLFMLARLANHRAGVPDVPWQP